MKIKNIIIKLVPRYGIENKIDLRKKDKLDDAIQDRISKLVQKGCGSFAENVDGIIIITDKGKKIKIRTDNYYYG